MRDSNLFYITLDSFTSKEKKLCWCHKVKINVIWFSKDGIKAQKNKITTTTEKNKAMTSFHLSIPRLYIEKLTGTVYAFDKIRWLNSGKRLLKSKPGFYSRCNSIQGCLSCS